MSIKSAAGRIVGHRRTDGAVGRRRAGRRRAAMVAMAVLVIGGGLIAVPAGRAGAAGTPPTVTAWYDGTGNTFFPSGGGFTDITTDAPYCLSDAANVTVTVLNSASTVVRTLQTGVSEAATCSQNITWDGTNDAAVRVPNGAYTVHVSATNSGGTGTYDFTRDVAGGTPGTLTTPTAGATLTGTTGFVFTPTPSFVSSFPFSSVTVNCIGTASAVGAGGTWQASGDTTGCANGATALTPSVSFTDSFGNNHTWTGPSTSVTIKNAPTVTAWYDGTGNTFFPSGGGFTDITTDAPYCLSDAANVTVTVRNSASTVVRTLQTGVSEAATCSQNITWDGTNDAAVRVPNGAYTVHVSATDAGGTGTFDFTRDVAGGTPGTLTTPTAGATLTGTTGFVFTPTPSFVSSFPFSSVTVNCIGTASAVGAGGTWQATGDTTVCANGVTALTPSVSFTDTFGNNHTWTGPSTSVTIKNSPTVTAYDVASNTFFPAGGGFTDTTTTAYYCLSDAANVTVTVRNSASTVVRTLQTAMSETAGCYTDVTWDGNNDSSVLVSNGAYTVHVSATDAGGTGTYDFVRDVAGGTPGTLTTPTAGATLTGTTGFVFTPTPSFVSSFPFNSITVNCIGTASAVGAGGTWQATGDTTVCANGVTALNPSVSFTDAFGNNHTWTGPSTSVTIANSAVSPQPTAWDSPESAYFFPSGGGFSDTTTDANYVLDKPSDVTVTILDSGNHVVRTIQPATAEVPGYFSLSWDGTNDAAVVVPDGSYIVHVSATNSGGTGTYDFVRDAASGTPGALTSPADGSAMVGVTHFIFAPSPGFVSSFPITQVSSCLSTGVCAYMYNAAANGTWSTTVLSGTLTSGPATISTTVSFTDPLGVAHTWTDGGRSVIVDTASESLQATLTPSQGVAPLASALVVSASDPFGLPLHYTVDYGDGTAPVTGTTAYPYDPVSLAHKFTTPGLFTVTVSTSNGQGNTAVEHLNSRVSPASLPVQLVAAPATGAAPLTSTFTLTTSDPTGAPINYSVPYGDGSVDSGTLNANAGSPPTYSPVTLHHTYANTGTFAAGASVGDAAGTQGRAIATVTVTGPPALLPNAGDPQVVVVGDIVNFDGTGSQPSAAITSYQWTFGDFDSGSGPTPTHEYHVAGIYDVTLTITAGGQQAVAHTQVTVVAPSLGIAVTVTDGTNPLPGALLAIVAPDGTRYSATTDTNGVGVLYGLPDGTYTVYAYLSGNLPGSVVVTQVNGSGSATIALTSGRIFLPGSKTRELSYDEIIAAGLDPTDPANQIVVSFEVNLAFVVGPATQNVNVSGYINGNGVWQPVITGAGTGDGGGGGSCGLCFSAGGSDIVGRVAGTPSQPSIVWMVVPGQAHWLKEFFDVTMLVTNLAPAPFSFDSGIMSLGPLPDGLSLAPTRTPQSTIQTVPDIPAGGNGSATWTLRGDAEGFYGVSATYQGILDPVLQAPLSFPIATDSSAPIHVWGASALHMTVDADSVATAGHPFLVRLGFTNDSTVDVNNFAVQLLDSPTRTDYIFQPLEQLTQGTAKILPGATFWTSYYLIPTFSGKLDPALSFNTFAAGAAKLNPPATTTHPPPSSVLVLSASSQADGVHLSWPASTVAGVTGYQVFYTPSPSTSFSTTPVQSVGAGTTSTVIAHGTPGCYALSTVTANGSRVYHTLACVGTVLAITTSSLPAATKGSSYTTTLAAAGGNAPYTWKLVTGLGKLPKGLKLNPLTGMISGTVSAKAITTTFSVEAFDTKTGKPKTQNHSIKVFTLTVA